MRYMDMKRSPSGLTMPLLWPPFSDVPTGLQRLLALAASAEACCALGTAYRDGQGVPADAEKAKTFRAKACDLGLDRCCAQ